MTENDSSLFSVDIENYNGPLDILLDLAKSQKVNLENISVTKLADQFHNFITNQKNVRFTLGHWQGHVWENLPFTGQSNTKLLSRIYQGM